MEDATSKYIGASSPARETGLGKVLLGLNLLPNAYKSDSRTPAKEQVGAIYKADSSAAVISLSFAPQFLRALLRSSALWFLRVLRLCKEMTLFNDRSIDDHQILSISYKGATPATQVDLMGS
ncbi:hypothetical protein RHMOL_Rhmol07G0176000 [Rhododendron molle]|uniref:Uncharacterized protein n=1 Tax=Rhododendron molle TaxID=49168 RepID=A0ACC0N2W1_RHOML|nr:hypothetical protein RHMOL_Rhmol07G0176000 [Rhododendron molle]